MKREVQGVLLILVGGAIARIVISGAYINYVKPSMKPYLYVSAAILLALGVLALYDAVRAPRTNVARVGAGAGHDHDDGHGHGSMGVAWLLLLPVAAVFLVAPGPLGAYTATREASSVSQPKAGELMPPLPPGDPVPVPLDSYATRAVWDDGRTLEGRTVELIGFVAPSPEGDGWQLTRLALACCAADTVPVKVQPVGDVPDLPANTWVAVTGRYQPGGGTQSATAVPWVEVDRIVPIQPPAEPYL
ncbi:MAG: TIGR03943 family protein [Actinobacteria bacterium]|nr:TIGR03943 family protein [Actinomycetota bacterium]MCB9413301.1 TIGR03943 family protein [Actinomycetota bacterium]